VLAEPAALGHALALLLATAGVAPPDEVPYTVTRRLFDLEHFVDFGASSPAARTALLHAGFGLLNVARYRGLEVPSLACPQAQMLPLNGMQSACLHHAHACRIVHVSSPCLMHACTLAHWLWKPLLLLAHQCLGCSKVPAASMLVPS
jgi:hypothetical protein